MNIRCVLAISLALPAVYAAELKPETLAAWDQYIQAANSHMQERLRSNDRFLWLSEAPDVIRQLQSGEIVVSAIGGPGPKQVPNGLIHDWSGAAFIPNASLAEIFVVVQDFTRYKDFYAPLVVASKPLGQDGSYYRFSMVLLNKALFSKTAFDCECLSSYFPLDGKRWYGLGYSTRIRQIENFGQPTQHELPPDVGSGYIWRLYSLSQFEERDGGVYVEVEAIALSRDIPAAARWFVDPIVRRISRGSLLTSLQQTRTAVTSTALATSGGTRTLAISGGTCDPSQTCGHPSGIALEGLKSFHH
jgi:hypothetical protein